MVVFIKILNQNTTFAVSATLTSNIVVIGRKHKSMSNAFVYIEDDKSISRSHMQLDIEKWMVRDLSKFGTFMNGNRIKVDDWQPLSHDGENQLKLGVSTWISIYKAKISIFGVNNKNQAIPQFMNFKETHFPNIVFGNDTMNCSPTHFIVEESDRYSAIQAMLKQSRYIITPKWLETFLSSETESGLMIWPDENEFITLPMEQWNMYTSVLSTMNGRLGQIFKGVTFLVAGENKKLIEILSLGSGTVITISPNIEENLDTYGKYSVVGDSHHDPFIKKCHELGFQIFSLDDIENCILRGDVNFILPNCSPISINTPNKTIPPSSDINKPPIRKRKRNEGDILEKPGKVSKITKLIKQEEKLESSVQDSKLHEGSDSLHSNIMNTQFQDESMTVSKVCSSHSTHSVVQIEVEEINLEGEVNENPKVNLEFSGKVFRKVSPMKVSQSELDIDIEEVNPSL